MFGKKLDSTEGNGPAKMDGPLQDSLEAGARTFVSALVNALVQASEQTIEEKVSNKIESLISSLVQLSTDVAEVRKNLSEKLPAMAGLDDLLKQHAKLDEDAFSRQVETLFRGLVPILDRIDGRLRALSDKPTPDTNPAEVVSSGSKFIKGIKIELLALLAAQGIEPFTTGHTSFSGKHHHAVKSISTDLAHRDAKIAKQLKPGYSRDGRVIRHELVEVFRFNDSQTKRKENQLCLQR
jgi:molecular chaperone GrpE